MSRTPTSELISTTAKHLFAMNGYDGVSMRTLAQESGVGLSSIYHFFTDKDILLEQVYRDTHHILDQARAALPPRPTAQTMLEQLIGFQFDHIEDIVYVLKYYLQFRQVFAALPTKTLPPESMLHVEEVLQRGLETGEFTVRMQNIPALAKVLGHTINGYLLEYYPAVPVGAERRAVIEDIVSFTMRGLA